MDTACTQTLAAAGSSRAGAAVLLHVLIDDAMPIDHGSAPVRLRPPMPNNERPDRERGPSDRFLKTTMTDATGGPGPTPRLANAGYCVGIRKGAGVFILFSPFFWALVIFIVAAVYLFRNHK